MNHVEKLVLFRWIQGLKPQPEVLLDPPAKLCTAADVFRTFAERIKVQEKGSMLRSALESPGTNVTAACRKASTRVY